MRRLLVCAVLGLCVLTALYAAPQRTLNSQTQVARLNATMLLSDTERVTEFNKIQVARNVTGSQQTANLTRFRALPAQLQQAILVAGGSKAAGSHASLQLQRSTLVFRPGGGTVTLIRPTISTIWPSDGGSPSSYSMAIGSPLGPNTKVLFNGTVVPSYFVEFPPLIPANMSFLVPAGTPLTSTNSVTVQNGGVSSDAFSYRVVAPRGYRGYYGWQFANFGDPNIPWEMFRDFFGAANVQYADGTHKLAAQQWYDSAYKGVGNGGNCYGMSVSSLRHDVTGAISTYWHTWFANPANHQSNVWFYPWNTQTKQAVQEDQGGQLSAEMTAWINQYKNGGQDHRALFNRAAAATGVEKCVLGMWGNGGHAIVPYNSKIVGDDHQLICYDNNGPYKETETNGPDPSVVHVYWGSDSFAYGSYNKAIAMSYAECMMTPHLPASAAGSMNSVAGDTSVAVIGPGAKVAQITDEAGHTFFNPDGSENQDPQTRIPNSSRFIPCTGVAPGPNDPLIFVFGVAHGKSLSFNLQGSAPKTLSFFQPGAATVAQAAGVGLVSLAHILTPQHSLQIPNPAQLKPTHLQLIQTLPAGERSFELQNLSKLGAQELLLLPAVDGSQLEVQSAVPVQFDLQVTGAVGRGLQRGLFSSVALQASTRLLLQPQNWQNVRGGALSVQLRSLQNNALQNQRLIQPH